MKITTWNVNGIRSLKKQVNSVLEELSSDVVCFQETKVSRSQLLESTAIIDKHTSYYSYPRKQSGYSGVATYCKDSFTPEHAEETLSGSGFREEAANDFNALDFNDIDLEGRVMVTYHLIKYGSEIRRLAIINVYCPRVDPEKPERHNYKMQFCCLLAAKMELLCRNGCFVIIVGDLNIACSIIDHCDPGEEDEFNSSEARQWLQTFLSSKFQNNENLGVVDAFRHFYPDKKNSYTCWNTKTNARLTNYGTRIDYILVSSDLIPLLKSCEILSDYLGSDHCPVTAIIMCDPVLIKNAKLPSICTRLWPEFSGQQQKLHAFFKKVPNGVSPNPGNSKPLEKKNAQKSITSFFTKVDQPLANTNNVNNAFALAPLNKSENVIFSANFSRQDKNVNIVRTSPGPVKTDQWNFLAPPKPPLCSGHQKECVLRTVRKRGTNFGKRFFMCPQPAGHSSNPDANCNYFKWFNPPKVDRLASNSK